MSSPSGRNRPLALIVSVGKQDIKYWRRYEHGVRDLPIFASSPCSGESGQGATSSSSPPLTLRQMHQELLDQPQSWRFAREGEAEESGASESELAKKLGCKSALHDSDGKLLLSPAKVGDIAEGIVALQQTHPNEFPVVGIAVVHTAREGWPDEPIASGPLILEYLGEKFNVAKEQRHLINAIQDNLQLEGMDNAVEDFPARRLVAHWLDEGLRAFIEKFEGDASSVTPVLLNTGGMAPVKDLLRAIAGLRFTKLPRDLSTPDRRGGKLSDPGALVESRLSVSQPVISRHEALEARARALYLVRRGDFQGAWAAVSQFEGSAIDQWWLQPLHAEAAYFGGVPGSTKNDGDISSPVFVALQNVALESCSAVQRFQRFALNAAMRLEAALQGPTEHDLRLVEALAAVCTLVDTLVVARASMLIESGEAIWQATLDSATGRVSFKDSEGLGYPALDVTELFIFRTKSRTSVDISSRIDAWSRHYADKFTHISALDTALRKKSGNKAEKDSAPNLRSLRNASAHRALTSSDAALARQIGLEKKVWRLGSLEVGAHALAPAEADQSSWPGLVDAALCEIGVKNASVLYSLLVGGLIETLLKVEPNPETPSVP